MGNLAFYSDCVLSAVQQVREILFLETLVSMISLDMCLHLINTHAYTTYRSVRQEMLLKH